MTAATDQDHLEADVAGIKAALATVISELKNDAVSGNKLDFASADALLAAVQGEAVADAPVVVAPPVEAAVDAPPAAPVPAS